MVQRAVPDGRRLNAASALPPIRLQIPSAIGERLRRLADLAYPFETCGTLVGARGGDDERVVDAFWAPNLARARDRFVIDPQAIVDAERAARRRGLRLLGFWHTHPDAPPEPSSADRAGAWAGYAQVLVAVDALGATTIRTFPSLDSN